MELIRIRNHKDYVQDTFFIAPELRVVNRALAI